MRGETQNSQLKIDALGVANVAQAMLPWKHALELLQRSPRRALPGAHGVTDGLRMAFMGSDDSL